MTGVWHDGVYVALGANLGEPALQVSRAMQQLEQLGDFTLTACSSLYASSPMGPREQPDYVNAVCCARTRLAPLELLDQLQSLEKESGRIRAQPSDKTGETRWGPRPLDLDLLLYGQQVINVTRLTVPHPGMLQRSFVLVPLLEIAPDLEIPEKGAARDYLSSVEHFDLKRLPDSVADADT